MKSFFCILFSVISAIFGFFTTDGSFTQLKNKGDISGYSETVDTQKQLPALKTDENGDFTVLQISDTHFTTGLSWNDIKVLKIMENLIVEYSPDLVVVSGDMIDDGESGAFNKQYVLDTVGGMFESLEQYWAYIPGNNDGIAHGTSADVTTYLTQFDHCLCADIKEISGGAQYSIDIKNNGKTVHSLIFLDTMDYDNEDDEHIYGYVHADQVEWCKNTIADKLNNNSDISMSVFIHENTPNFANATLYGEAYSDDYATISTTDEKFNIPKNAPLDEVFEAAGCVGLVSMGHKHPSECECSYYNGIYYQITAQAKKMSTLITIHTSANNTKDMYDFVKIEN